MGSNFMDADRIRRNEHSSCESNVGSDFNRGYNAGIDTCVIELEHWLLRVRDTQKPMLLEMETLLMMIKHTIQLRGVK